MVKRIIGRVCRNRVFLFFLLFFFATYTVKIKKERKEGRKKGKEKGRKSLARKYNRGRGWSVGKRRWDWLITVRRGARDVTGRARAAIGRVEG